MGGERGACEAVCNLQLAGMRHHCMDIPAPSTLSSALFGPDQVDNFPYAVLSQNVPILRR